MAAVVITIFEKGVIGKVLRDKRHLITILKYLDKQEIALGSTIKVVPKESYTFPENETGSKVINDFE